MPFLLLFLLFPLLELTVFFYSARIIGLGITLLLCIISAVVGAYIIRHQSWQTLRPVGLDMRRGTLPSDEIFDRLCIMTAGVLLLTPGLITDVMGLLLLIPFVRHALRNRLARSARFETAYFASSEQTARSTFTAAKDSAIIEGEYEKLDDHGQNSSGTGPNGR